MLVFLLFLVPAYPEAFGPQLWLVVPALAVAVAFTVAMSLLASALNVRYRDVEHLLEIALLAWFWLTPIVYRVALVQEQFSRVPWLFKVYMANPMTAVVVAMQRAIYRFPVAPTEDGGFLRILPEDGYAFYLRWLGVAAVISLVLLAIGLWTFRRLQADFAEEL
jgi:ABC-2 type transport system permease protein